MLMSRRAQKTLLGGYLIAVAVSLTLFVTGGTILVPLILAGAPAVLAARSRMSLPASLSLVFVIAVWATFGVFTLSRYAGVPVLLLVVLALAITSIACAIHLYRRGSKGVTGDATGVLFASAGGLVWCAVITIAALTPAGSPVSWSMTGDAANNILFARRLIEDGGISLGSGQNPVPLTAAMIALFMLPSRGGDLAVGSQIVALAQMWSVGIVMACVLSGAFALALVRQRSSLRLVAAALTSLVPLSWVLLAGPILLGFVNFHLTLALILACMIALVGTGRALMASIVTVSLSIAAMLMLWAPLAVIPCAALAVVLVTHWRRVLRLRRARLALTALALAQPAFVFFALSLPSLLAQRGLLQDALGAVFEIPRRVGVVFLLAALVLATLHVWVTRRWSVAWVTAVVVGGGGLGLGALLWLRRNEPSLWSYYQLKYFWLWLSLLMILVAASALSLAAGAARRTALSALAATSAVVLIVGAGEYSRATVPTFSNDPAAMRSPLVSIVTGDFFSVGQGDRVFHRVAEMTELEHPTLLWRSGDPDEDWILFWIIQMSAHGVEDVELRKYAYYHDSGSIADLCEIRRLMGGPVAVITASSEVAAEAAATCPGAGPVQLVP